MFVRSSVRLLPAFLRIGSLVFPDFWHKDAKWQCRKCDGARFLKKNFLGQIWAKNCPKNRVFWTLCKIASLVFSGFWQKDRVQGTLKCGRNNFPRKILFSSLITDFRFLGKFPFTNFLSPAFLSCRHLFKLLTAFSYSLAIFLFLSDFYRQVGPFSTLLVSHIILPTFHGWKKKVLKSPSFSEFIWQKSEFFRKNMPKT